MSERLRHGISDAWLAATENMRSPIVMSKTRWEKDDEKKVKKKTGRKKKQVSHVQINERRRKEKLRKNAKKTRKLKENEIPISYSRVDDL